MTKYFKIPFADGGDKTVIPDAVQLDGSVSLTQGWGPDYELEQGVAPSAKDIPRDEENQIKFWITEAIKEVQEKGVLPYRADVNYENVPALVSESNGKFYRSKLINGPDTGNGVQSPLVLASIYWEEFGVSADKLFNPDPSATFKDPGTVSFGSGGLEGSGQRGPVIDSVYEHLNLPVKFQAGGAGFTMARGRNMGGSVWSNDFGAPPTTKGAYFAQAYWYDTTGNNLYWLSKDSGGAPSELQAIQKVNVVDGTWTETMAFDVKPLYNANHFGMIIYPVTPATPDTSDWVLIYPESISTFRMFKAVYNSAGVQQSLTAFKVDIGGAEEDEVNFAGGYITAAHDLMITPIFGVGSPASLAAGYMTFTMLRGSTRTQIVLPVDGIAPIPESAVNIATTGITSPFNVMLTAWGDAVLALTDDQTGAANALLAYFGTRIWDRASFDEELHNLADLYSMDSAEVYF